MGLFDFFGPKKKEPVKSSSVTHPSSAVKREPVSRAITQREARTTKPKKS